MGESPSTPGYSLEEGCIIVVLYRNLIYYIIKNNAHVDAKISTK